MEIAITGSTGLIGEQLVTALRADGHGVVRFVRPGSSATDGATAEWDPATGRIDADALGRVDAVVHLAGVGIADSRWTADQKRRILESRTQGTTLLAEAMASLSTPPPVLLSGSAIGYYGDHGDRVIDESTEAGDDFPARVCVAWEGAAAAAVESSDIRVAFLRTGIVQSAHGGALARQLPFFKLGLGGKVHSGRQYISWISIQDEIRAIEFLLTTQVEGPVNLVAPTPVTNAEYAKTLGAVLHRPTTILPITGPRVLFGRELADSLLLTSQRCAPDVLTQAGFEFRHPELRAALRAILD